MANLRSASSISVAVGRLAWLPGRVQASAAATADGLTHIPPREVHAIDTTAAGDCFVGVLAAGLDRGLSLEAACRRASVAAALACTRPGSQASLPTAAEIDSAAGVRADT